MSERGILYHGIIEHVLCERPRDATCHTSPCTCSVTVQCVFLCITFFISLAKVVSFFFFFTFSFSVFFLLSNVFYTVKTPPGEELLRARRLKSS